MDYQRFGVRRDWFRSATIVLANSWAFIAIAALLGGLLGLTFSLFQQPTYQATAVLYQAPVQGDSDSTLKQRTQGITALLTSEKLISAALQAGGIRMSVAEAQESTTPTANAGSSVVNIVTTTHDPETSARLANALAATLPKMLRELDGAVPLAAPFAGGARVPAPVEPPTNVSDPNAAQAIPDPGGPPVQPIVASPSAGEQIDAGLRLSMISPAMADDTAVAPKFGRNIVLGVVAGLLFGVFVSYLTARVTRRVQDGFELSDVLGGPLLASVPLNQHVQGPCLVDLDRAGSPAAEAFRRMRIACGNSDLLDGPARRIIVTSPSDQDGKTTTAVNLARALALNGSSVVLVDAALRTGSSEPHDGRGLIDFLQGDGNVVAMTIPTRYPGLSYVAAGGAVANPTEVLGTARLRAGFDELSTRFDYVIVDSPSLRSRSDAIVLASAAEAVLMVVRSNKTRYADLGASIERLDSSGILLLGVVLNGYPRAGLVAPGGRAPESVSIDEIVRTIPDPAPAIDESDGQISTSRWDGPQPVQR